MTASVAETENKQYAKEVNVDCSKHSEGIAARTSFVVGILRSETSEVSLAEATENLVEVEVTKGVLSLIQIAANSIPIRR